MLENTIQLLINDNNSDTISRLFSFISFKSALAIIISLLGALLFIISLFTSIQRDNFKAAPNTHVITSINSTLKSSPTDTASNVIQLDLGSNIRVISARNNWAYIEAPNDLSGWIRNKAITKLWPYNY